MRNQRWFQAAVFVVLATVLIPCRPIEDARFVRGDAEVNGELEISDTIRILGFLFLGEPSALECLDAADTNDSGELDLSDAVFELSFLFLGGALPPRPFPDCGDDPSPDPLDCRSFPPCTSKTPEVIRFTLAEGRRVSLAVYDKDGTLRRELLRAVPFSKGTHEIEWDGLDGQGALVADGEYEWRLLETPGFTARFVATLGVNPSSRVHGHFYHSWVGDHLGAGSIAADATGVYIGSLLTEGLRQILKQSFDGASRIWQISQWYDGGKLTRLAADDGKVFVVQPNGKLRYVSPNTGRVRATWSAEWDGEPANDVDYYEGSLAVAYPEHGAIRWLDPESGAPLQTVQGIGGARNVAVRSGGEAGEVLVEANGVISSLSREAPVLVPRVQGLGDCSGGIDIDRASGDLYVVERTEGLEVVHRYDAGYRRVQTYGGAERPLGPYSPALFRGVTDIAADGQGSFLIAEPRGTPRRVARFEASSGRPLSEWYGGQSFYVHAAADRTQPEYVWGCAEEGSVNQYRIDYDSGEWDVVACYRTGNLGDSLYPFTGKWRPVRRGGKLFLVLEGRAAVVRVDEAARRVVPVAIASKAHSGPRTFSQFGGSGRDGYPIPYVAAADLLQSLRIASASEHARASAQDRLGGRARSTPLGRLRLRGAQGRRRVHRGPA